MAFNALNFTALNLAQATDNELKAILGANTDAAKANALNVLQQPVKTALGQTNTDPNIVNNAASILLANHGVQTALGTVFAARAGVIAAPAAGAASANLTDVMVAALVGARDGATFKNALAAHADVATLIGLSAAEAAALTDDAANVIRQQPGLSAALGTVFAERVGVIAKPAAGAASANLTDAMVAALVGARDGATFKNALAAHADVATLIGLSAAEAAALTDDAANAIRQQPGLSAALAPVFAAKIIPGVGAAANAADVTRFAAVVDAQNPQSFRDALKAHADVAALVGLTVDQAQHLTDAAAEALRTNPALRAAFTLSKIELPALREALIAYAVAHQNFKPNDTHIAKLNKAIAEMNTVGFDAANLSKAVNTALADLTNPPPINYFEVGKAGEPHFADINDQFGHLHPLHNISDPILRQVLFDFGGSAVGVNFRPTESDVKKLNAALANLPANATTAQIDTAIQTCDSFQQVHNGVPLNYIATHARGNDILQETQRLAKVKEVVAKVTPAAAGSHPKLMNLVSALPKSKQEELLANDASKLKKLVTATTRYEMRAAARDAALTNQDFKKAGFGVGANPMDTLVDEQKIHGINQKICNAKIAEVLSGVAFIGDNDARELMPKQIDALNDYLKTHTIFTGQPQAQHGAKEFKIEELLQALDLYPKQNHFANALRDNLRDIMKEHYANALILQASAALGPGSDIQKREADKVFARIEKTFLVVDNQVDLNFNDANQPLCAMRFSSVDRNEILGVVNSSKDRPFNREVQQRL